MTSEVKKTLDKATDALGGMAGKMTAAMTTEPDGFVENAAIGDMYEIAAAGIALRKGRSDHIRMMARQMIADHTTSKHQLQAALEMNETRGVAPPPRELDMRRQTMIRHLEEAPEDGFDAMYLDQQVLAHEETVTLMRGFEEHGHNPQLRSYAAGTRPVVERHLNMVREMRAHL
jgi:putative membrane protein